MVTTGPASMGESAGVGAVRRVPTLFELLWRFAAMGSVAFGGPVAHLAMIEREVERQGWGTRREVLEHMAFASAMPGPNSTQAVIMIGRRLRGPLGGVAAGVGFIGPGAVLVGLLSWLYLGHAGVASWHGLDAWVQPVVVAIIAVALVRFGRSSLSTRSAALAALVGAVIVAAGWSPVVGILAGGAIGALFTMRMWNRQCAGACRSPV